jgi:hypothetical protein
MYIDQTPETMICVGSLYVTGQDASISWRKLPTTIVGAEWFGSVIK